MNTYFDMLSASNNFPEMGKFDRIGQIKTIIYVDDERNISKKYVEYDVIAFEAMGSQTSYRNVRSKVDFAGLNDYQELILEDNQVAIKGKLDDSNAPQNKNGAYVVISFVDGNFLKPYISASLSHPGFTSESTKEKGIHKSSVFRGFKESISKDGEKELTYTGPKTPDARPVDDKAVPVTIKVGKDDKISTPGGHSIALHKNGLSILMKDGTSIKIDTEAKEISIQTESKLTGTAKEVSLKDADGASVELKAGAVTAIDSSGGTLKLKGGKVGLGASSAELVDLVYQIANLLSTEAPAGFGSPLVNSAQFAQLAVKATGIKGGI